MRRSEVSALLTLVLLALQSSLGATSFPAQMKLVTAAGYLPQVPFLVLVVDYRITNCVLWASAVSVQSDFAETNFTIRYSAIAQPWPGEGNTGANPMFVDEAAHNFHLLRYSPAIDSGAPISALDPDGSPADRGAFTFIPPSPVLFSSASTLGDSFQFFIQAYTNRSYAIESSPDSVTWTFLKTVLQSAETNLVTDASSSGVPHRFIGHGLRLDDGFVICNAENPARHWRSSLGYV